MKWLAVKERESQRWYVVGPMAWTTEDYYPHSWSKRTKKRGVQKSWISPKPEHVSPFIECHSIVDAATIEEAKCLTLNWK